MNSQRIPVSHITARLDDVDESLHHLRGVLCALRFMSEDLQLADDTPANAAFWAVLAGGEAFVDKGLLASANVRAIVKRTAIC